jgi:hypothetical protein
MTDKQQPGDDGPPRGPVVQRDDGLWAIGWHEGAPVLVGLRSCASRLSPPIRAPNGQRYRPGVFPNARRAFCQINSGHKLEE